ncbi:MAG: YigZ family protein [Lachnospiraceae bacterium]|nr:YigZ family protein [Lachnospiraceae bacterium]
MIENDKIEQVGDFLSEYIVIEGGTGEIVEKKSRFIATVQPVNSEEEALAFIAEKKKQYWDARHNCMAYVVGGAKRFSDDGEPSGTAGKPILDVIEGNQLSNAVIVVTRYFGGILLGTGGLVRAYQKAAAEGIHNSVVAQKCEGISVEIKTDYNGLGKIQYLAGNEGVDIVNTEYLDYVMLTVVCETEKYDTFINKVTEATAGKSEIGETKNVTFYRSDKDIRVLEHS